MDKLPIAAALDEVVANYLEWERQDYLESLAVVRWAMKM